MLSPLSVAYYPTSKQIPESVEHHQNRANCLLSFYPKNSTSTPTPKKRNLIYAAVDTKKPYVERKVGLIKSFTADIVNYAVAFCIACLRTAFWRLNTIRPSKPINMALKAR